MERPVNSMSIFEQKQRVDLDVALHSETTFAYLDRSARPEMGLVRGLLDDWFGHYPDQPGPGTALGQKLRDALRSRFRSRRERQQTEAFWELYLHESLIRAGSRVTVRADTPDFEVTFGGRLFHLEATVRGLSDDDTGADNRVQALRDAIDRANAGEWILEVSASAETARPAPAAALRRDIEVWLRGLDIDAIREDYVRSPAQAFADRPTESFERDGWTVSVRVIPKRKGVHRSGRQPAIGIWGGASVVRIDNSGGMVDALRTKAARLRTLNSEVPVVVAVLLDRAFADEEGVESALFGTEAVRFSRDSVGRVDAEAVRANDGFWSREHRDGRRIDAVLAATRLDPCLVTRCTPLFWTNPWRHRSPFRIPSGLPWAPRWFDEQGSQQRGPAQSPAAFFGLMDAWPETHER